MDIDCPEQAVAVWMIADQIYVRFPDRQLITIPANEILRLSTILRHRETFFIERRAPTVGTEACPVQYDIDAVARAIQTKKVNEAGAARRAKDVEAAEREKRAPFRRHEKRMARKDAEEFLAQLGL